MEEMVLNMSLIMDIIMKKRPDKHPLDIYQQLMTMIMITKWILEERIWLGMEMMILPDMVLETARQEGEIFLDTRMTLVNMDLGILKLKEETNQHTTMIRNSMVINKNNTEMMFRVEIPKNSMMVTRDNMRVTKDSMKVTKDSIMMNNNNIMMAKDSIKIIKDNIMTLQ